MSLRDGFSFYTILDILDKERAVSVTAAKRECYKEELVGMLAIKLQGRNEVALEKPSHEAAETHILLKYCFVQ